MTQNFNMEFTTTMYGIAATSAMKPATFRPHRRHKASDEFRRGNKSVTLKTVMWTSICVIFLTMSISATILPAHASQQKQLQQLATPVVVPISDADDDVYNKRFNEKVPIAFANLNNGLRYLDQINDVWGSANGEKYLLDENSEGNSEARGINKRNYQHIWRNVQMRMPVYSQSSQLGQTKRSLHGVALPPNAVNIIYRQD